MSTAQSLENFKEARLRKDNRAHIVLASSAAILIVVGFPLSAIAVIHGFSPMAFPIMFGCLLVGLVAFAGFLLIPYQCAICSSRLERRVILEECGGVKRRGFLYICAKCQGYEKELYYWSDD